MMSLREFQSYLKKEKISLAFFTQPDASLTYFTGCRTESAALLAIMPKKAELYLTVLEEKPKLRGIAIRRFQKGWDEKFKKLKIRRLGINKKSLTLSSAGILRKIFPKAKFVDLSEELDYLRNRKTPKEIKKIAHACKVTDYAFKELLKKLPQLKTERQAADFLDGKMREKGCSPAFPTVVAMGKNAAIPHYNTSNTKLKRGFLLLDFGARYRNYNADMTRTIFLGRPDDEEKEKYAVLLKAQITAIKSIKEGKPFSELHQEARKNLGRYSSYFIHLLGHGIGLEVHEAPSYAEENKDRIAKGQVFTVEPGIYFPGKRGIRIEDMVLFDGKVKVLTQSQKNLISLKY